MLINLTRNELELLKSVTWCALCGDHPATGFFAGVQRVPGWRLTPFRAPLCDHCAENERFERLQLTRQLPALTVEQAEAVTRWDEKSTPLFRGLKSNG